MKRLTKVMITAELWVEDIRPEKARKKIEKNLWEKVICKPYVGCSVHTIEVMELDTGEE
jgi:hypothetical protein